jgi:nickel transport protein
MVMKKNLIRLLVLVATSGAVNADAHGIWFAERSDQLAMIYGEGASDDNLVERRQKITGVAAYNAKGETVPTALIQTDYLMLVDTKQEPAVVTGALDNGFYTTLPDGSEVNKGKSEVPGARSSGQYLKYAVHVRGDLDAPLGVLPNQVLQITPVNAKLPRHKGEPLQLRVLFRGKPLAKAAVSADFINDHDGKPVLTDDNGIVTLDVRSAGLNVIMATYEQPTPDSKDADKTQYVASLSFVLPDAAHE